MKFMKRRNLRLFAVAALLPLISVSVPAQSPGQAAKAAVAETTTSQQLTQMVHSFLADVPKGDRQIFDNFFADDVIYTRSAGLTVSKADILKNIDVRSVTEPGSTYDADDFTVHPYGAMAVVNFRLVQHVGGQTNYFRNTGTFLKRNEKWQAVAWQSTRVPPAEPKPPEAKPKSPEEKQ